jgi:hypothetical protein
MTERVPFDQMERVWIAQVGRSGEIVDQTFSHKKITGPAVLFPDPTGIHLDHCGQHGDAAGAVWLTPMGTLIQGAIRLIGCKFEDCVFENIGWTSGEPGELHQQVLTMFDGDSTQPGQWPAPSPHKD